MKTVWCVFWTTFCVVVLLLSISHHWGGWYVAWAVANLSLWIGLTAYFLTRGDR